MSFNHIIVRKNVKQQNLVCFSLLAHAASQSACAQLSLVRLGGTSWGSTELSILHLALTLPEYGKQRVPQIRFCPCSLNLKFAGDGSNERSAKAISIFNLCRAIVLLFTQSSGG